jgi:hypothetical protein
VQIPESATEGWLSKGEGGENVRLGVALGRSVRGHRDGPHLTQHLLQGAQIGWPGESEAAVGVAFCCFFPSGADQTSDVFRVRDASSYQPWNPPPAPVLGMEASGADGSWQLDAIAPW